MNQASDETLSFFYRSVEEELLHVFLINNPITALISRLIVDFFRIDQSNVMIISIRNTDTKMLDTNPMYIRLNFADRVLTKFFNKKPLSKRILAKLEERDQRFLLYSSWAYDEKITTVLGKSAISSHPSVEKILKSKLCIGHSYIEEGQASYRPNKPYPPNKKDSYHEKYLRDIASFKNDEERLKARLLYREDALAFFGILSDVFPDVDFKKRIILSNLSNLKSYYKPKLSGVRTIGLTCATRRIKEERWEQMIKILIEKIDNQGVIKLHPSFTNEESKRNKIEAIFKKIAPNSIHLCDDDVNLELEMLYEPKRLIGPRTSLKKYALAFGSEFIDVELY